MVLAKNLHVDHGFITLRECLLCALVLGIASQLVFGQGQPGPGTGALAGQVADPAGAIVVHSVVTAVSASGAARSALTDRTGRYAIPGMAPGAYEVKAAAVGFADSEESHVELAQGQVQVLNFALSLQQFHQQVRVDAEADGVSASPDANANAMVLNGADLDALSDDPDELLGELEALAGPAAGPNGGEIYIDGFTGGSLPPKSAIREIRVNQNPFSAQYERLGYGRIEIFTKPGTSALHGQIGSRGNDSAFNSRNPILAGSEPDYFSYDVNGAVGGPLGRHASFLVSAFSPNHQNTSVVNAIDPASISDANPNGTLFNEPFSNPNSRLAVSPRIDLQLGQPNTLSLRFSFSRAVNSGQGVGETNLPAQAYNMQDMENSIQLSDSLILGANLMNDLGLQYRRIRNRQFPVDASPTVTVQGAFTDGGSSSGSVEDKQDDFELHDNATATAGTHTFNFGGRLRVYQDSNTTNAGTNGAYTFESAATYLSRQPQKYTVTVVNNPTVKATLLDAALYYQDDWRARPDLTFSYGLRWESQNRIADRSDWAPRLSLAWAPASGNNGRPAKTVLRAGYGWFYQRFTVPNSFASMAGTPYLAAVIHENGTNQSTYTVTNPIGYQETSPGIAVKPPMPSATASAQTQYSIAQDFRAANDMQTAVGIDREVAKHITANLTYLYSRGVHQYLTNNLGAPAFPTAAENTYPDSPLPAATSNRMQFQSGGVYRESQIIASATLHRGRYSLSGFYTHSQAKGDTSGATYVPSVAQDPGFDYGRTSFDVHHRVMIVGSLLASYGFSFAPMFVLNSGTPFNITAGSDLTGNNQFNARPAFGNEAHCLAGDSHYVATSWGCLDDDPIGTGEKIVPYGLGTGPVNIALNLRLSKVIGIGPRGGEGSAVLQDGPPPPPSGGPGDLGPGGLSGAPSGPTPPRDAPTARCYSLTFTVDAHNLFNYQNLGTPNGVLTAPPNLRFRSQSLAGGPFSPPEGGNRSIFFETRFNF